VEVVERVLELYHHYLEVEQVELLEGLLLILGHLL
jgi:hypothetical protein